MKLSSRRRLVAGVPAMLLALSAVMPAAAQGIIHFGTALSLTGVLNSIDHDTYTW